VCNWQLQLTLRVASQVVQEVGETIYVPQGWWHCVLNCGLTVAATENVMLKEMLSVDAVSALRATMGREARRWLKKLAAQRPELMGATGMLAGEAAESDSDSSSDEGVEVVPGDI
jgi:hypothetical protein